MSIQTTFSSSIRWGCFCASTVGFFFLAGCSPQEAASPPTTTVAASSPARTKSDTTPASSDLKSDFKLALPGYQFQFPRDHGSHPEYATEWWYYTGHLRSREGRKFGYQLTWFRTALTPEQKRLSKWAARDLMFAHFALTDETGKRFFFTDSIGRANIAVSGAESNKPSPRIWVGPWKLQFNGPKGNEQAITASGLSDAGGSENQRFSLALKQKALKEPVIQGINGVSQKSAGTGRASHYYSFTRLQTSGSVSLGNETFIVEGQSWFDHEFGSNQLGKNQVGWDWFSLQLDNGSELMLYRLRLKDGGTEPFSSGTWVNADGTSEHLKLSDFQMTPLSEWKSPQTGANYPDKWKLEVPSQGLVLNVEPSLPQQELIPTRSGANLAYWEGSVYGNGTQDGKAIKATGYLEMTGYASAFEGTF